MTRHVAVESAWLVDRAVLFDERDGVVHELNPSASAVWELIDGQHSARDIMVTASTRFGEDLAGEVTQVLAEFSRLGLISGVADDPA